MSNNKTTSDVERAAQVISDLEQKRAKCVQDGTALADERASVALAAHTGDDKAAKRLEEIHKAIVVHGSELASLDAALKAAGDRLSAAKAAEARAEAHRRELEWRKEAAALREDFETLDEAAVDLAEAAVNARDRLIRTRQLGPTPTDQQFLALGARALKSHLMTTPWMDHDLGPLPPSERRNFMSLFAVWIAPRLARREAPQAAGVIKQQPEAA
jgi:hypothetical protein